MFKNKKLIKIHWDLRKGDKNFISILEYLNSNEITADLIRKYSNNSAKVQKEVEKSNYLNFFDNEC